MIVSIQPSTLKGNIVAAASKSSMQRACAAALVQQGIAIIHNPGISNDDKAALDIIKNLGATVTHSLVNNTITIDSNGVQPIGVSPAIHCGESGLSIRMFSPIVSLSNVPVNITGEGSLATRPMDFFDQVLPQLGVQVLSNHGKLPLTIQGPLLPKNITIDGSLSSQFLTGLLMAYSVATLETIEPITITVINLKSKPYIDLTLKVMEAFNLNMPENVDYEHFVFKKSSSQIPPLGDEGAIHYTVEGDWSGAAFLLVAGAIAGNITVKGLDVQSTQADKKILEALTDCGCHLSIQDNAIDIALPTGNSGLKPFHFNATDCPDLFPPLVALAAYCNGKTVIEGVSRLAHKESDRGITLQKEFGKMGIHIELHDDLMIVNGGNILQSATVHSHHDHRIAMACAVAALQASGTIIVEEAEAVNKSYPNFYEHIKQLGAAVMIS